MAVSEDDRDFQSRSASFLHWLHQQNITLSPKIELADLRSKAAGRGVLATDDIETDEELFRIPRSSILTVENSSLPVELKEVEDPWLSLIIAMIYEYQRGGESIWKPYFDILPTHFDTLMFWSESELEALQGSAVVEKIGKKSADEAFKTKVIPLVRQHASAFRLEGTSDEELLSLCHRMGSTIMAYAFDLERPNDAPSKSEEDGWEEDDEESGVLPKGMVPFADTLNADADRKNANLFYEEDKVVMKSVCPIAKGEEILNDYGPLPNADVLRRYGYVTSNYDKYDIVEISLDTIKEAAKGQLRLEKDDINSRLAYLDEHGIMEDGYDVAHLANEDGQFVDEFCTVLNAIAMPKADLDRLQKKDKLPKPDLSKEGATLLADILRRRRALYQPDEVEIRSDDVDMNDANDLVDSRLRRKQMARHIIAGEKSILLEAADTVEKLLMNLNDRKRKAEDEPQTTTQTQGKKNRT